MSRLHAILLIVALGQPAIPVSKRLIEPRAVESFRLSAPLDAMALEYAVGRVSASVSSPFGLELAHRARLANRVGGPGADQSARIDLAGMTLSQGLDAVLRLAPEYAWREENGVVNVFPARTDGPSFLSEPINGFDATGMTARRAIEQLHRQFDSQYPSGPEMLPGGMSLLTGASDDPRQVLRRRAELDRRMVAVSVVNGTVRDVLNQIVASHGAAAWVVDYDDPAMSYAHVHIRLILGHGLEGTVTEVPFPARWRSG